MTRVMKVLLLGAVAGTAFVFAVPRASDAADDTPARPRQYFYHRPHVRDHSYYRNWYEHRGRYDRYGPGVRVFRFPHGHYDYQRDPPNVAPGQRGTFRFERRRGRRAE